MPTVSLIVASGANHTQDIGDSPACRSLLAQTFADWEAILVGHSAANPSFPEAYAVMAHVDALAAQFNSGLSAATGEWVLFLDSASELLPDTLSILLAHSRAHPAATAICGFSYWRDGARISGGVTRDAVSNTHAFLHDLAGDAPATDVVLMHRDTALALGGFDERLTYAWEYDLLARWVARGHEFAILAESVVVKNYRAENRSVSRPEAILNERLSVLQKLNAGSPKQVQACLHIARLYMRQSNLPLARAYATMAYVRAVGCAQTQADHAEIARALAADALDADPQTADTFVQATFSGRELAHIKNRALALVHEAQAFDTHARQRHRETIAHAAQAILRGGSARTNRGLWKIAARSLLRRSANPPDILAGEVFLEQVCAGESLFISPHFDDVVLSCGGLLARLSQARARATLLTVFTSDAHDAADRSPLAYELRALWGEGGGGGDVLDPYAMRAREDETVAHTLGLVRESLGFAEAPCRYPRMRSVDELVSPGYDIHRDHAYDAVKEDMRRALLARPGATVFAPLALGHLDHLLVFDVLHDLVRDTKMSNAIVFYEDYPYAAREGLGRRMPELASLNLCPVLVNIVSAIEERWRLSHMYASQMVMLFENESAARDELQAFALRTGNGVLPCERYWAYTHK